MIADEGSDILTELEQLLAGEIKRIHRETDLLVFQSHYKSAPEDPTKLCPNCSERTEELDPLEEWNRVEGRNLLLYRTTKCPKCDLAIMYIAHHAQVEWWKKQQSNV